MNARSAYTEYSRNTDLWKKSRLIRAEIHRERAKCTKEEGEAGERERESDGDGEKGRERERQPLNKEYQEGI